MRSIQAQSRSGLRSSFFSFLFPPFAGSVSLLGVFSLSSLLSDWFISVSNFVIWVSNLRILSLGLLYLWFGFPVHLCVSGFGFLVVIGEAWAVVEVACTFVWIFVEGYDCG